MLQPLGGALQDPGLQKRQAHKQVRVGVLHPGGGLPRLDQDAQLLPAFPDEGLGLGFARLHLAAGEFPQQAAGLLTRPLADEDAPILPPDEGGHHLDGLGFGHGNPFFPL